MKTTRFFLFLCAVVLLLAYANTSQAKISRGDHPYYLHALSDLRAARWMIEHRPGNWKQTMDEVEALKHIDQAIRQ